MPCVCHVTSQENCVSQENLPVIQTPKFSEPSCQKSILSCSYYIRHRLQSSDLHPQTLGLLSYASAQGNSSPNDNSKWISDCYFLSILPLRQRRNCNKDVLVHKIKHSEKPHPLFIFLLFFNLSYMQTHYFTFFLSFFYFLFYFIFYTFSFFLVVVHRSYSSFFSSFFLLVCAFVQTLTNAQFHTNVYALKYLAQICCESLMDVGIKFRLFWRGCIWSTRSSS